jgi:FKBP-type peptidyl-prolyl cis-trans isomerase
MRTLSHVLALLVSLLVSLGASGCNKRVDELGRSDFVPSEASPSTEPPGPATLQIEDVVVGKGREVVSGDNVSVHYTGTLMSGKKFDSSRDRGKPFEFQVNMGRVIKGWDQGIMGMKVGGKRKLTIPASLAYGDKEQPGIPANSGLKFDLELLSIK